MEVRTTKYICVTLRLLERKVHYDLSIRLQAVMLHHAHHTGDRNRLLGIEPDVLPDGIVVRPELLGELLVDDRHLLAVAVVVIREEPALKKRDPHGLESSRLLAVRKSDCSS